MICLPLALSENSTEECYCLLLKRLAERAKSQSTEHIHSPLKSKAQLFGTKFPPCWENNALLSLTPCGSVRKVPTYVLVKEKQSWGKVETAYPPTKIVDIRRSSSCDKLSHTFGCNTPTVIPPIGIKMLCGSRVHCFPKRLLTEI